MAEWMNIYDGVFFLSLATIFSTSFAIAVKYCLKSKCEKFSLCCGLISIDRRVDLEVQEEIKEIELGTKIKEDDEEKQNNNTFSNIIQNNSNNLNNNSKYKNLKISNINSKYNITPTEKKNINKLQTNQFENINENDSVEDYEDIQFEEKKEENIKK